MLPFSLLAFKLAILIPTFCERLFFALDVADESTSQRDRLLAEESDVEMFENSGDVEPVSEVTAHAKHLLAARRVEDIGGDIQRLVVVVPPFFK